MMIRYYYCKLLQQSPLRLSNGDSDDTDSDLMLNLQGYPFIPGSALTGVLRDMLDQDEADLLFGCIDMKGRMESKAVVSDALLPEDIRPEDILITHRDGVGLNQYGTAKKSAKYNFQVAETDKPYTAIIELQCEPGDKADVILENLMKRTAGDGISLGARTTRGYGHMSVTVTCVSFSLDTEESLKEWLAFDPFSDEAPETADKRAVTPDGTESAKPFLRISAELDFRGTFSVRVYSTKGSSPTVKKKESVPDYAPLKNKDGCPVIPGTSWAGMFRHHILAMGKTLGLEKDELDHLNQAFGVSDETKTRSRIVAAETAVKGGNEKIVKRNAVDRFTAGPAHGALYCASVWNGGTGTVEIKINHFDREKDRLLAGLLLQSFKDIHLGLLTFGGEGGVGRGGASVTGLTVNGRDFMNFILQDDYEIDTEGF